MAKLLLGLYRVPDDEAAEIRALLDEHGIDWYETPPSRWGVSHGGLWARDEHEAMRAQELLARYQRTRRGHARAAYAEARRAGTASLLHVFRADPVGVLLRLLAVLAALALVALPFYWAWA